MHKLEQLKIEVNEAYKAALDCPCYLRKRNLIKVFHEKNKRYNNHKEWLSALVSKD